MHTSETKQVRSIVPEELETGLCKENQLSTAQQHWSNMVLWDSFCPGIYVEKM